MDSTILAALISLLGSIVGTLGGIMVGNKLMTYRVEQLEKKLDEYKQFEAKIYALEAQDKVLSERLQSIENLINERFDNMRDRQNQIIEEINLKIEGGQ